MQFLANYIQFIREAERLKSVLRTAWSSEGRPESTAEHSWRLTLLASLMLWEYPELNREKVLVMSLVHDLGELYEGDISAAQEPDSTKKHQDELRDVMRVLELLPEKQRENYLSIWNEYNENKTPEAHLVKALDKAETIIQHNQGKNPEDFSYEFNLMYGMEYFEGDKILEELRVILDEDTRKHIK